MPGVRTAAAVSAIPAFPLTWPDALPRTDRPVASQFRTSLSAALKNVKASLELFAKDSGKAVTEIVLSSNAGGLDFGQPEDPGVAAWFEWDGQQRCIAVDRYPKVEDNLQAIHHILEARRTEMRHGGLHIVRQTFKGFTALPAPAGRKSWREVLGFRPDERLAGPATIDARFRELAAKAHPDKGGSSEAMHELTRARAEAKAALS
jgi:hypothetical protein